MHDPLEAPAIARRQEHRLVNVKTAMRPAPHVLHAYRNRNQRQAAQAAAELEAGLLPLERLRLLEGEKHLIPICGCIVFWTKVRFKLRSNSKLGRKRAQVQPPKDFYGYRPLCIPENECAIECCASVLSNIVSTRSAAASEGHGRKFVVSSKAIGLPSLPDLVESQELVHSRNGYFPREKAVIAYAKDREIGLAAVNRASPFPQELPMAPVGIARSSVRLGNLRRALADVAAAARSSTACPYHR